MNTLKQSLFSIPLTHILLVITITIICTIFSITEQKMFIFSSCYLLIIGYAIYKNKTSWILLLMCMITSSLLITLRINYQFASYKSDQSFLKRNIKICGVVEQINHSTLIKDQKNIIITTSLICKKNSILKSPKKITLFFPSQLVTEIQENDYITIQSIQLEQPSPDTDYQLYLIKENFWAVGRGTKSTQFQITHNQKTLIQQILFSIHKQLHTISSSLFEPLFLGKKEKNIENLEIQHKSIYWGIAHHMARSGAHLAILFGLIMMILHYTRFAYFYRYIFCIFLLIGYHAISQPSISFIRSLIMILIHIIGKTCNKIPSSLHTITITTLATLFYNPMQLFFLDFQLSFGITYIIIWLFNIKNSKTLAFYKYRLVQF